MMTVRFKRLKILAWLSATQKKHSTVVIIVLLLLTLQVCFAGRAPEFRLEKLDGQGVYSLSDSLGENIVLLEFWSTCCGTRLSRMAYLDDLIRDFSGSGLKVFSVNVDSASSRSRVNPAIRKFGFDFPVLLDPFQETFKRYHPPMTLPYTVIIDKNGMVLNSFTGELSEKESRIRRILEQIINSGDN
jgi:peroxiredoxin